MPVTVVIIDEVQVFLENTTREQVGGRKITLGEYIADLLTYLVRKGPAAGIVIVLATQRPARRPFRHACEQCWGRVSPCVSWIGAIPTSSLASR